MKLYFKDEENKLRVVDTGGLDVDLSEQLALRNWVEQETNIRVKSPVLSCHTSQEIFSEPLVA